MPLIIYAENSSTHAFIDKRIEQKLKHEERVNIIISLNDKENLKIPEYATKQEKNIVKNKIKNNIKKSQSEIVNTLNDEDIKIVHKYTLKNAISGFITKKGLEKLKSNPNIRSIVLSDMVHASIDNSVPLINADDVGQKKDNLNFNLDGYNQTICLIDSGVDSSHQEISGSVIHEECFCGWLWEDNCCPNNEDEQSG
ncbi:MAG: hypothetical protein AABW52_02420, partial [Nanoarchaeota archaeon]